MQLNDANIAEEVGELIPARRVALVHDWLTAMRGGEKVFEEFCRMFPKADVFTLIHAGEGLSKPIEEHHIIESPIARLPWGRRHFRMYLPLFPWAVEAFDLKGYDLVISSSHAVAKAVIPPPDAPHIAYIHTPMRYVWDVRSDYLGSSQLGGLERAIAGFAAHYLRTWDTVTAARVDKFVANSQHVRDRIRKYYRRDAAVVYPPVDVERFSVGEHRGEYFLTVSALVPYKRVDLAIEACNRLELRLIVVGDGSERKRLMRMAGRTIEFAGPVPFEKMADLYRDAKALIHAGEEDFGIAMVEAQACGCPVIAYGRGGALEIVIPASADRTGVFFHEQSAEALVKTLREFDSTKLNSHAAQRNSQRFDRVRFNREMTSIIREAWEDNRRRNGETG